MAISELLNMGCLPDTSVAVESLKRKWEKFIKNPRDMKRRKPERMWPATATAAAAAAAKKGREIYEKGERKYCYVGGWNRIIERKKKGKIRGKNRMEGEKGKRGERGKKGEKKGKLQWGKKGNEQQWGGKVGQRGRKKGKEYSRTSKRKDIGKGKQKEGEGQEIYETRKRGMGGRGQGRERRKGDRT